MTHIRQGNKPVHGTWKENGNTKIRSTIFKELFYWLGFLRRPKSNEKDINNEILKQLGIDSKPKDTNDNKGK